MKGIIFNAFEKFIIKTFDRMTYEKVLKESELDKEIFVGLETYEDQTFMKIVSTAVTLASLPLDKAVFSFGKFLFPFLISRSPQIVEQFKGPKDLIMNLDKIIHVEVNKIYQGSQTPNFSPVLNEDGSILLTYKSKRSLPDLVEGLLSGLGDHYQVEVQVERIESQAKDVVCQFKVTL